MIYVNLNSLRPGQAAFDSTIVHEFQHMAHFNHCPEQEGWIDEGASELAMRVAGYESAQPAAFAARPDVQLNSWSSQTSDVARHYQASYLFLRYVAERAGGWAALPRLFETCARGEALFDAFLQRQPIAADLPSLVADWSVANLVQDGTVADGRYAYANGGFHAAVTGRVSRQTPFLATLPQYAANFVELPQGSGRVTFSGDPAVPLLGAVEADPRGVWWSNRADSLDSRLTRSVDLRGVTDAHARFRVWYDTEDQYDFVYFSASRDGGRTWQVLPGRNTVADDATGNHFGAGWTGSTAAAWLDEDVDLSSFGGSEVALRFEYVTDQSYNAQGFAFADFRVPRIGLDEPGAAEAGWQSEGWVRVDAPVPERWGLRLVRWLPSGIALDAIPVSADGTATFALDPAAPRATLAIVATAPRTLQPASYAVTVGD
jgi:hypothetical protein